MTTVGGRTARWTDWPWATGSLRPIETATTSDIIKSGPVFIMLICTSLSHFTDAVVNPIFVLTVFTD